MTRFLVLLVLLLCSRVWADTSPRCAQAPNLACAIGTPATQDVVTVWNFATGGSTAFTFEGATADAFETAVVVTDPTVDRTLTIPNADTATAQAASCSAGNHLATFSATTGAFTCTADTGGGSNALLDGSVHSDTLAGTVVRGDVIVGNSTPKWSRLAIGGSATFLRSNGTDAAWTGISSSDIGPGDLASALTWNESKTSGCSTGSPCALTASPRAADTAIVVWRTLVLRRVAACGGANEYTLSGANLALCDNTGIGSGADAVFVTYEL